jgi:hypothetical protein
MKEKITGTIKNALSIDTGTSGHKPKNTTQKTNQMSNTEFTTKLNR